MKIKEVHAIPLYVKEGTGGWEDNLDQNMHTLLQVVTDEGIWGIGSVYTSLALVEGSLKILKHFLIGEDPTQPSRVTEKLNQVSFWQGRGGALTHTISGIDMALWDIAGKAAGLPVSKLLGGCYRNTVRPYGSILFDEPERLKEKLNIVLAKGFRSIKLGWDQFGHKSHEYDELLVKTARETVGKDVELMVDAGGSKEFWPHGLKWALRTARMLSEYDISWFEEPLNTDHVEDYVKLRELSPVPISCGEILTRRQSFLPYIEKGAVDILQPDNTKCGGLSETIKMAWYAYDHGIKVVCHGWNTAVGVAADLAFAAASPLTDRVEYMTPSPYIDGIMEQPFVLDADGNLPIPTEPGLGIRLNPDKIERMSGKKIEV